MRLHLMSWTMAEASSNIILTKQLAIAVTSLQWSYAIFWSSSQIQHGVLEWGEGYYNGDIKKRKKKRNEEGSKYGLERSNELRNLYLRMLQGKTTHDDDKKTSGNNVMLSPDDLSDEEWYYLLCMSYVFSPAHCLPGKALATGEAIWLCNAQNAETKLFTRSLLAKSASIQTVVCFPYLDGVIELGVTQLIAENHHLIQHIKDCLLGSKLQELKDGSHQIWSKSDEDLHDNKTLSITLLGSVAKWKDYGMKGLTSTASAFLPWKPSSETSNKNHYQKQSNVLWKILHDVPLMHSEDVMRMFQKQTNGLNQCVSMDCDDHPSDRTKENQKFSVLKSMVPTVNKGDKESILKTAIKYLQDLEARVEELESRITKRGNEIKENVLSELIEETSETEHAIVRDETKVRVKLKENEVLVDIRCAYREYIVADIMEAMSNLHMDAFSIRSHTHDGIVVLSLKATLGGAATTSTGMIKREVKRVVCGS